MSELLIQLQPLALEHRPLRESLADLPNVALPSMCEDGLLGCGGYFSNLESSPQVPVRVWIVVVQARVIDGDICFVHRRQLRVWK